MKNFLITIMLVVASIGASANQWYGEEAYLACNPDVRRAMYENRNMTAYDHYMRHGMYENRVTDGRCFAYDAPSWFVEQCYLMRNPDVRRALQSQSFMSGWHHYRVAGQYENRSIECR